MHPDDERYRGLVGRQAVLPLIGRLLPVVADAHVDPSFGTGALKVTPAHDADDAEIAMRHGLPSFMVIGPDGRLTSAAGERFAGLGVAEAREAVVAALEAAGALVAREPYEAAVGRCSRCGTVVEPLISRQWFLRMRALADAAAAAVEAGDVRFVPEGFTRLFLQWMEQAHDWCLSRQLWWGHRIPAYECQRCGHTVVDTRAPERCPACGAADIPRDPDVLDTWFSSALWPFSTLGWPERSPELEAYYPTDLLVTGRDILFFWVARMVFSGLRLTGQPPFRTVLLHGLVRDSQGRKMSKSLGNGIDPLEMMDRYGTDALRLTLTVGVAPGNDMRFLPEKIEGSQRFCNKLWNAARFVLGALEDGGGGPAARTMADRWIQSRLGRAAREATAALERLDPGLGLAGLQSFVWDELCDWYLEAAKVALGQGGEAAASARATLTTVLDAVLRLLHPFLPFVTEELWSHLPGRSEPLLAGAAWPVGASWEVDEEAEQTFGLVRDDEEAEHTFGLVRDVVSGVRSLRAELRVNPGAQVGVLVHGGDTDRRLQGQLPLISTLARIRELSFRGPAPGEAGVSAVVPGGVEVVLLADQAVDLPAQLARLTKELEGVAAELVRIEQRLGTPAFRERARPEVVQREQERRGALDASRSRLRSRLSQLRAGDGEDSATI